MARIYLHLSVDAPTDDKLIGRPVVERHLWTCLLCLAKKAQYETGDPTIRGHDAKLLASRFNLGSWKAVQNGLDYFIAAKPNALISIDEEGSIYLTKFIGWQGEYDAAAERERWRLRQEKSRASRRDKGVTPPMRHGVTMGVTPPHVTGAIAVAVASKASRSGDRSKSGESEGREITACESVDNPAPAERSDPCEQPKSPLADHVAEALDHVRRTREEALKAAQRQADLQKDQETGAPR